MGDRRHRLPGDRAPSVATARMLRVDHAGEFGAVQICRGQLDVLRWGRSASDLRQMAEAEERHLAAFDELLRERHVRPSLLLPIWRMAGYALGAATALLGERAAMACTVAIEKVIDEHYDDQAERLAREDPGLRERILGFRDEEIAHRDLALARGAEETPGYDLLGGAIAAGSRLAIWLSTRL